MLHQKLTAYNLAGNLVIALGAYLAYRFIVWVIVPAVTSCSGKKFAKKFNQTGSSWALVTGCTSGIGAGFARGLAKHGFNVLMVSRSEAKLKETKAELLKINSKINVEYFSIDLSSTNAVSEAIGVNGTLMKFLDSHEISVLVNNAGMNTEYPKFFSENSESEIHSIVDVNCTSLVMLTRAVIGRMKSRKSPCSVINISSLFGQTGAPLLAVYSGTKSFIDSFSASLGAELRDTNISVFCSLPGFVVSNMSKIRRTSLTVISPDNCAESVLGQVAGGFLNISAPHWSHNMIGWFLMDVLPERLRLWLLMRINTATNKAALRKLANAQGGASRSKKD